VDSLKDKKGGEKVPFFGLATPKYGFLDNTFKKKFNQINSQYQKMNSSRMLQMELELDPNFFQKPTFQIV